MDWETVKKWFRIGKEIGFRLLREDCRHCNGKGICHSGRSENYGISCASCQNAALGEVKTHVVRCEVCNGRGVFVYALPSGDQFNKVTIEVLPKGDDEWSTVRVHTPPASRVSADTPALPAPRDARD
jgi:hypothetical protein